jgi:hypothetical protein
MCDIKKETAFHINIVKFSVQVWFILTDMGKREWLEANGSIKKKQNELHVKKFCEFRCIFE